MSKPSPEDVDFGIEHREAASAAERDFRLSGIDYLICPHCAFPTGFAARTRSAMTMHILQTHGFLDE